MEPTPRTRQTPILAVLLLVLSGFGWYMWSRSAAVQTQVPDQTRTYVRSYNAPKRGDPRADDDDAVNSSSTGAAPTVAPRPTPGPAPPVHTRGSAFVTYSMGEIHCRMALTLMQSLRETGTKDSTLMVLVGHAPKGGAECEAMHEHGYCVRDGAPVEDLISGVYLRAFQAIGVELRLAELVPRSEYTEGIAGGPYAFWGSAFNKIQVLKLVEFSRIVWMDSDTIALQNLDHLMKHDEVAAGPDAFSAAFTINCCTGVRGKVGGSLWVFEPSQSLYDRVLHTASTPAPWGGGGVWTDGDQQIVAFSIAIPLYHKDYLIEYWPWLEDYRQGLAPGFQYLPHHRGWSRAKVQEELNWDIGKRFPPALYGPHFVWNYTEGLLPKSQWLADPGPEKRGSIVTAFGDPGPNVPVWHPLDARYDIMVGSCECQSRHDLAGRVEQDSEGIQMTAHFSCLQPPLRKPGEYESEEVFMGALYNTFTSCHRWYFLRWYDIYKRALSHPGVILPCSDADKNASGKLCVPGYPNPLWTGPTVPVIDVAHDAAVVKHTRARVLAALAVTQAATWLWTKTSAVATFVLRPVAALLSARTTL